MHQEPTYYEHTCSCVAMVLPELVVVAAVAAVALVLHWAGSSGYAGSDEMALDPLH